MSGRSPVGAVALTVGGGLVVAGGTSTAWVRREVTRRVGEVALAETLTTPGTAFAPQLVGAGTAAVVVGLALLVLRGSARRAGGAAAVLAGVAALGLVVAGGFAAAAAPGALAAGSWVAGVGALLVAAGGALAARGAPARRALPPRYSIDEPPDPEDGAADEWRLSSVEPEDR